MAGASRFETALEIAKLAVEWDPAAGEVVLVVEGETKTVRTALLGTGLDFPDSVAAGAGAYATGAPVLLTAPDELHSAAETALEEVDIDHVFALGGEAAVAETVLAELEERGLSVERLAGANRWETAVEVAERFEGEGFDFDVEHVGLATGADFADALASTSYLGSAEAPLVLADAGPDGEPLNLSTEALPGCSQQLLPPGPASWTTDITAMAGRLTTARASEPTVDRVPTTQPTRPTPSPDPIPAYPEVARACEGG